jgi:hypothetical protein
MMSDRLTGAGPGAITLERRADAAENLRAAFLPPSRPDLASAPPAGLLLALDRAAKVAADLDARSLSVRFETGADSRVRAQVIDAAGNVVRQLAVGQALELLAGHGLSRVDELGSESP